MSFDSRVYFDAVPDDLPKKWQAALRELGMHETVKIAPDWEKEGFWYLLDKPSDDDGFLIEVGPFDPKELEEDDHAPDEREMLASARYCAFITTRLGSGSVALMVAGSLARATGGVVVEYQDAAFQDAFEADLAAHRGPRGPEGKPTLAERGHYDSRLAWEVAKAARKFEQRQGAGPGEPPPKKSVPVVAIVMGLLFILWALNKLHKAGYF